ncbi:MAG: M24 family metallopeptidase [Phycisphaerales bacterium JB040]
MAFRLRTPTEIDAIAEAGGLVAQTLTDALGLLAPGITGRRIDLETRRWLEARAGSPALSGYTDPDRPGLAPFAGAISIGVNDAVANSEPDDRPLQPGDLVTLDLAASLNAWHADASVPAVVGGAGTHPAHAALADAARAVTRATVRALRPGGLWSDAVVAAHDEARRRGVHIARVFAGHGIGRALHEPPQAGFDTRPGSPGDFLLAPGTVFTVEPIVTPEPCELIETEGVWGVRTETGCPGACAERTVAVTGSGVRTLCGVGA